MRNTQQKRQNFNVTPDEESDLVALRDAIGAPSAKDAVLRAVRLALSLKQALLNGGDLYIHDPDGKETRLLVADFDSRSPRGWQYLVGRPDSWKRQLYIKGRRLTAANVWFDMLANRHTEEQAAENWDLPRAAVREIVAYCEANSDLIGMEADEEKRRLQEMGGPHRPA